LNLLEKKKSNKIYNNILTDIEKNKKFLKENISITKANQSVIDNYFRKGLINSKILNKLIENKIIKKNSKIIYWLFFYSIISIYKKYNKSLK